MLTNRRRETWRFQDLEPQTTNIHIYICIIDVFSTLTLFFVDILRVLGRPGADASTVRPLKTNGNHRAAPLVFQSSCKLRAREGSHPTLGPEPHF